MTRAVVLGSLILTLSVSAQAQDGDREQEQQGSEETEAAAIAQAGYAALLGGRFESALGHFRAAYALHDDPYYLLDIAKACDALRRDADARAAYREYLRRAPSSRRRAEIEARIRAIETAMRARPIPSEGAEAPATADLGGTLVTPGLSRWEDEDEVGWFERDQANEEDVEVELPPPPASRDRERDRPAERDGYPSWMWTLAAVSVGAAVVSVIAVIIISSEPAEPSSTALGGVSTGLSF